MDVLTYAIYFSGFFPPHLYYTLDIYIPLKL